jgi:hypothetical protein
LGDYRERMGRENILWAGVNFLENYYIYVLLVRFIGLDSFLSVRLNVHQDKKEQSKLVRRHQIRRALRAAIEAAHGPAV